MTSFLDTCRETEHRLKNLTVKILDRRETGFWPQIFVQVIGQKAFTSHNYNSARKRMIIEYERDEKPYLMRETTDSYYPDSGYVIASKIKYEKDFLNGLKFWINELEAKKYLTFI